MKMRLMLALVLACLGSFTLWAGSTPSPALLVLAKQDHILEIVDPATLKVVAKIPAGNDPHEVTASADGKLAYISNYGAGAFNTISVADLVAQRALPRVDLGALRGPHGLDFAGGELYFTAEVNKIIGRLNPATRKIDWLLGTGQDRTHMLMVSRDLTRIYTSNVNSGTISIIEKTDGHSGTPPAPPRANGRPGPPRGAQGWEETIVRTGRGTEGFDISPNGRELWSAAAEEGTISIINVATKKLERTLDAHVARANRVKFTPDGKYVFVSMLASNSGDVAIFEAATRREVKRLSLGRGAGGILMQPDASRAFVSCSPDNYVAVIDLKTLKQVARIETDRGPDGLAWAVRK
ncbi:MAG TPA: YncE family protein [Terriglobia bacterium]|nr:YncE family protein [Terriglobia bacterium]